MKTVTIPYRPRAVQMELHNGWEAHRWSVSIEHRRLGKSVAAVNHLIKQAIINRLMRPRYAYVGPFLKQTKKIAWDYLKHFTADIPGARKNESELLVSFPNGAEIQLYGADNPDAIRGIYLDGCVLDEAAQIKREIWGEVIRPMLADRKGWAIFIGTPKGMENLLFERYESARNNPDWFVSLHRADKTGIIPSDELAQIREDLNEAQFRQEMLCDWTAAAEDALIDWDLVHDAAGRHQEKESYSSAPLILSIDVARFGDDSSVFCWRQGLVALEFNAFHGKDTMTLADRAAYEIMTRQPAAVFVDVVGLGAGVVDRLNQLGHEVIPVNGGSKPRNELAYYNKRAEMWADMRDWLDSGASIPDIPSLRSDLLGPTFKYDHAGRLVLEKKEEMKKRGLKSPDYGDALAMSFAAPVPAKPPAWMVGGQAEDLAQGHDYNPMEAI